MTYEDREIRVLLSGVRPRSEFLAGRPHLVVPVVALMEGVVHAVNADSPELVPAAALAKAAASWNGRPLVLGHPVRDGRHISANDPLVIAERGFGTVFASKMNGTKLGMEAWVDVGRLEALGKHELLARLRAGDQVEVSVGAGVHTLSEGGMHGGKKYLASWDSIQGDHLAFLETGRGACSIAMGCGVNRVAAAYDMSGDELRELGGAGSGNFNHEGRPGVVGGSSDSGSEAPAWKSEGGFEHTGIEWKQPTGKDGRPIPIKVKTVEEACTLVLAGKVVEVEDARTAHTLINKLADLANEAKAAGKDAPEINLCNVTVKGSSMFCAESLRSAEYPEGVERLKMPQLGGKPVAGTEADKLPRDPYDPTKVNGSKAFVTHLQGIGITTNPETVPAANLRASQNELIGQHVASMMNANFDPGKEPIFISKDNYIVDGHHRWAAVVGRDAADGKLGDLNMNVIRVNAPISELLHLANAWSRKFGIAQAAGVTKQAKKTGLHLKLKGLEESMTSDDLRALVGKTISAATMVSIQAAHDTCHTMHDQTTSLGAACNGMKLLETKVAGGHPAEEMTMNKQELITSLTECPCSGFTKDDVKALEGFTEARLTALADSASANKKALDDANTQIKALGEKKITREEILAADPEIKALIEKTEADTAARKAAVVTTLKACQTVFSEDDLNAMDIAPLEKIAALAAADKIDQSGRSFPAVKKVDTTYAAPNPYEAGLKALQQK